MVVAVAAGSNNSMEVEEAGNSTMEGLHNPLDQQPAAHLEAAPAPLPSPTTRDPTSYLAATRSPWLPLTTRTRVVATDKGRATMSTSMGRATSTVSTRRLEATTIT